MKNRLKKSNWFLEAIDEIITLLNKVVLKQNCFGIYIQNDGLNNVY